MVPKLPWPIPKPGCVAKRVKPGALIVRARLVVAVRVPDVPVIVTFVVPPAAVLLAVGVSTLLPLVGFVPHEAVTPLGSPDVTARLTLPVNPYRESTVMVLVPVALNPIAKLAGEAESEKLGP